MLSRQWIERVVGWLGKVFLQDGPSRPTSPEPGPTLRRWRCHVQRFFYRIYAGLRIEELFSIIRGRPARWEPLPLPLPSAWAGGQGHGPRTASASGRRGTVSAPSLCTGPWALLCPSAPQGGCAQVCGSLRAQGPHQAPHRASLCGVWRCGRSPSRPPSSCLWAHHMCTYQDQPFPTDFPDSRPAVEDLKYCLERTDQRPQLLVSLRAALETRLLHPGAAAGPPTFALRAQTRDLHVT